MSVQERGLSMAKRILIVEDDKAIARLLRDNLEYEGFVVETCETVALRMSPSPRRVPRPFFVKFRLPIVEATRLLRCCRGKT